jgi:hypothetical protein
VSQRRGTAAYGAAFGSSTVTGKRYECSPHLSLRSTALGRFLDNVDASQRFLQIRRKRQVVPIGA